MAQDQDSSLYIVRDGALMTESAPMTRAEAGRLATEQTLEAGRKGEAVAVRGIDRFTVKRAPTPPPPPARTYTALEAEAALCLWEAMLDARLESTLPTLDSAFEAAGSAAMRHYALALAPWALEVHSVVNPDGLKGGPYGYAEEVIPAIVAAIVWTGGGYILKPVSETALEVAAILESGR